MFCLAFDIETAVNVFWGVLAGGTITGPTSWFTTKRITEHHEDVHESFRVLAQGFVQIQEHPETVDFRFEDGRLKGLFHDISGSSPGWSEDKGGVTTPESQEPETESQEGEKI